MVDFLQFCTRQTILVSLYTKSLLKSGKSRPHFRKEVKPFWQLPLFKVHQFPLIITKTRLFNYIENFTTKNWKFSDKNSDIFHTSAQNTDCGYSLEPPRRGGSNEYPQSVFLSRNKKNNVYPCTPQFYYIKVGFKGVKITRDVRNELLIVL